jgi:hypothetical protein
VAPSFLVTAVLAFFNVAVKSVQENQKIEEQEHPIEQKTVPLLCMYNDLIIYINNSRTTTK